MSEVFVTPKRLKLHLSNLLGFVYDKVFVKLSLLGV